MGPPLVGQVLSSAKQSVYPLTTLYSPQLTCVLHCRGKILSHLTQGSSFKSCSMVHTRNVHWIIICHFLKNHKLFECDTNYYLLTINNIRGSSCWSKRAIHSSSALSRLTAGSQQVNCLSVYTDADVLDRAMRKGKVIRLQAVNHFVRLYVYSRLCCQGLA